MAVWVSPLPESLPVEPGASATVAITVRNDSKIVDEYAIEVLGDAAAWTEVEPATVNLMPGTAAQVTITSKPPRESTLAPGRRPLGVKATSIQRPDTTAVVEGSLEILPFDDLSVDIFPRTSRGSSGGKHEVAFDNRGNRRIQASLNASDPDGALRFRFDPPALDSLPGTATFAKLRVRHRRRFLRGPARLRPFSVLVEPDDAPPLSVNGTAVQERLVPTWALGGLLGLGALALIWALFVTPKIQDTAKNAAEKQALKVVVAAQTTPKTDTGSTSTPTAPGSGSGSSNGSGNGNGSGSGSGSNGSGSGSGSAPSAGPPFSKRLQVSCADSCSTDFKVPAKKTFGVTDIVLGNPNNAKGTLTIRNNDTVLFVENLDNFRDLDFHFGTPVSVTAGHALRVGVKCAGGPCSAAAFFSGTLG